MPSAPPGFVYIPNGPPTFPYAPACPGDLYEQSQYEFMYWWCFSFGLIGTIQGLILIPPYILVKQMHNFPGLLILEAIVAVTLVCFLNMVPAMAGGASNIFSVVCLDDHTAADIDSSLCAFLAFTTQFLVMFAICIWYCVAQWLSLKIMQIAPSNRIMFWGSNAFSLVICIIQISVMAGYKAVQPQAITGGSCGFSGIPGDGWPYQATFPFILIFFLVSSLATLIAAILYVPLNRKLGWQGIRLNLKAYSKQWRLGVYYLIYFIAVLIPQGYDIYTFTNRHNFADSIGGYYKCRIDDWVANNQTYSGSCAEPFMPTFPQLRAIIIIGEACTLAFQLLFILDPRFFRFYYYLARGKLYDVEAMDQTTLRSSSVASSL